MSNKKSLVEQIRERLNTAAGKEIAKVFSEGENLMQVKSWIPLKPFIKLTTGGGEGFPCGHITQIVGKLDSGKTTLAMEGMIATQKLGGICYLIDSEHKFSLQRFQLMGGKPEEIVIIQVKTLEEAWEAIETILNMVRELRAEGNNIPMMALWDSIAGSTPKAMLEGAAEDQHFALEAKINNRNVRRLRQAIEETELAFVGINHYYMSTPKNKYEQPEMIIKGGEEISFFSTLILLTKKGAKITRNVLGKEQQIGRTTRFTVFKGHHSGRSIVTDVFVVDKGILESKEELAEYQKGLRGEF
jgi:RecA/RadA recombinase